MNRKNKSKRVAKADETSAQRFSRWYNTALRKARAKGLFIDKKGSESSPKWVFLCAATGKVVLTYWVATREWKGRRGTEAEGEPDSKGRATTYYHAILIAQQIIFARQVSCGSDL